MEILTKEWQNQGTVKLQAGIFSNVKGNYLTIMEVLPDRRAFAICSPQSFHSSG